MNGPHVGFGEVRHARIKPVEREFAYPTLFLLLPLRTMHAHGRAAAGPLAHNRRAALSFHDRDHGDGRGNAVDWLDEVLQSAGIHDATGEAWLQCYPRLWGYVFKPVSFWYCERTDGSLRAIVVEVNNTFGERHCYVLDDPAWGRELQAAKCFHVSPFCRVEGRYRFRFWLAPDLHRSVARIDHDDDAGPLLRTSISGQLLPATAATLRRALWRHPLLTLAIIARIHWQALLLWRRGIPVVHHERRPLPGVTTSR